MSTISDGGSLGSFKPSSSNSKTSSRKDVAIAGPTPSEGVKKANNDLVKYLYGPHNAIIDAIIMNAETKTSLKRENIAYIIMGLVGFFFIFSKGAHFLCNLTGFGYPAYVSVKAIRSVEKDDDTKWLTYWTVFGAFSVIDTFAETILHYFPIYYLVKAVFLMYLYLPQTEGAEYFYNVYVDPIITKIDALLKEENKEK